MNPKSQTYRIGLLSLMAGLMTATSAQGAVFLTDANLSDVETRNNQWATHPWNYDSGYFYFMTGGPDGQFINGAPHNAAISLALVPGTTCSYALVGGDWGSPPPPAQPSHQLNLFFNGALSPGISVAAPTWRGGSIPAFAPNGLPTTFDANLSPIQYVPGANTATFIKDNIQVTLTEFYWGAPEALNRDLVGAYSGVGPDGVLDYIGGLTLEVTAVPEPQQLALVMSGILASLAGCRFLRRRS